MKRTRHNADARDLIRIGPLDESTKLWSFAYYDLKPAPDRIEKLQRSFLALQNVCKDKLEESLKNISSTSGWPSGLLIALDIVAAGSVANGDALFDADLDTLLVLNAKTSVDWDEISKEASYRGQSIAALASIVHSHFVESVNKAIGTLPEGAVNEVQFSKRKALCTVSVKVEGLQGEFVDFDLLPVFKVSSDVFLSVHIEETRYSYQQTANGIGAKTLRHFDAQCRGQFLPLVRMLKFIAKTQWNVNHIVQKDKNSKLTSCTFESAAMKVLNTELSSVAWLDPNVQFSELFKAPLRWILASLRNGTPLPAPNAYNSDVLSYFRTPANEEAKDALIAWIDRLLGLDDISLLSTCRV